MTQDRDIFTIERQ